MNIKKISIVVIIILSVILSGVIVYSITDSNIDSTNGDNEPQSFNDDDDDKILSNPPQGITEDNNNLELNETKIVSNHKEILELNSASINIEEEDVSYNIQKDSENTYVEVTTSNIERYSNSEYTIVNNDNTYSAINEPIESDIYTKEYTFRTLMEELEVDSFSEKDSGDIELRLTNNDEDKTRLSYLYGFDGINYASVTLTITTDGLIKTADIELIGNVDGVKDSINETYTVSNVNESTFSQPNWLSDAENTVAVVDGLYQRFDGQILIQHHGLSTIPEGNSIKIINPNTQETHTVNLPDDFSEGDSLGLSLLDNNEWDVTINDVPRQEQSINSNRLKIVADNNNQEYFNITLRS